MCHLEKWDHSHRTQVSGQWVSASLCTRPLVETSYRCKGTECSFLHTLRAQEGKRQIRNIASNLLLSWRRGTLWEPAISFLWPADISSNKSGSEKSAFSILQVGLFCSLLRYWEPIYRRRAISTNQAILFKTTAEVSMRDWLLVMVRFLPFSGEGERGRGAV